MSDNHEWQGFPGEAEMVKANRAAEAKAKREAEEELSKKQQTALAELQGGRTFREAARAAGVHHATLYRWVKSDPAFRAAYNAWEQEACESARARLVMASGDAIERIISVIQVDGRFAFKVLKELGIFRQRPAGPIDPDHVRQQIELEMKPQEPASTARLARLAGALKSGRGSAQIEMLRAMLLESHDGAVAPSAAPAAPKCDTSESVASRSEEGGEA